MNRASASGHPRRPRGPRTPQAGSFSLTGAWRTVKRAPSPESPCPRLARRGDGVDGRAHDVESVSFRASQTFSRPEVQSSSADRIRSRCRPRDWSCSGGDGDGEARCTGATRWLVRPPHPFELRRGLGGRQASGVASKALRRGREAEAANQASQYCVTYPPSNPGARQTRRQRVARKVPERCVPSTSVKSTDPSASVPICDSSICPCVAA